MLQWVEKVRDLYAARDIICPERVRLLRQANDALLEHGELVKTLSDVAGQGRPEVFAFLRRQVAVSSDHVMAAFAVYSDHLELHGCGRFKTLRDSVLAATQ